MQLSFALSVKSGLNHFINRYKVPLYIYFGSIVVKVLHKLLMLNSVISFFSLILNSQRTTQSSAAIFASKSQV